MGVLDQAAVVRSDVRLTLSAIDHQSVDLIQILRRQLDRSGEAGSAQSNQATGPDGVLERL